LIAVGIVALCLGYWRRSQELRNQAAEYHLQSLRSGYLAVRVQKPQSAPWEADWRKSWKWPSPLAMDRASVSNAVPLWQESIENARKSQYCLHASSRPWLFWSSPLAQSRLPPLPADDDDLGLWWDAEIRPHVDRLGLNQAYGYSSGPDHLHLERDLAIQNGAQPDVRARFVWADIRATMPVEDGYNDEAEQNVGPEPRLGPAVW
jgi:hypothetical protein